MAHPKLDDWFGHNRGSLGSSPHLNDTHGNAIREASKGNFRVIAEDHKWYQDDWVICEYDTLPEAKECADEHFEKETWYFVYDDAGKLVHASHGKKPLWQK